MNELTVLSSSSAQGCFRFELVTSIIDKSFLTIYSTSAHTDCMVKLLKNVDSAQCAVSRLRIISPQTLLSTRNFEVSKPLFDTSLSRGQLVSLCFSAQRSVSTGRHYREIKSHDNPFFTLKCTSEHKTNKDTHYRCKTLLPSSC